MSMATSDLWAGALSLLLLHDESGCPQSALHAARLLDRLSESTGLDEPTRCLCERASERLKLVARWREAHDHPPAPARCVPLPEARA
jgi:hypothetical protein